MNDGNYIKINRKILDWEWYGSINTCRLFVHMLLKANWRECKFQGTTVPRGSFVSSYPHLAEECGMTINELRTALKHLKSTGEVTVKTNNKYSVFSVNNYCQYQDVNSQIDSQGTGKAQSINSLLTPIEEIKEERKEEDSTISNDIVCQTDVRRVMDGWNELQSYGISPVSKINTGSQRQQRLHARIREYGIDEVLRAIENTKSSPFLLGRKTNFVITFDWFVRPNNFPKVLDGNYIDKDFKHAYDEKTDDIMSRQ